MKRWGACRPAWSALWRRWAHAESTQRVLVVHKTSRLELERRRQTGEGALRKRLQLSGRDFYQCLLQRHQEHVTRLEEVQDFLRSRELSVRMCSRESYSSSDIEWADLVLSAGGDGNFLYTASQVLSSSKLVVGINTDPSRSEGYLCLRSSPGSVAAALSHLLDGPVQEMLRVRVRVKLGPQLLPVRALNEVYIGERNQAHSSYYELSVDGGVCERQKSSGLLVYTGSGSTSWAYNINKISAAEVEGLLAIMSSEGLCSTADITSEIAEKVAERYSSSVVFAGDDWRLAYAAREPIVRGVFAASKTNGFASRVEVTSRSWNSQLVVDGQFHYDLPFGTAVVCELHSEDSLRTVPPR